MVMRGRGSAGEPEYALSVAAMERNLDKIKELLKKGADPNSVNGRGTTVLLEVAGEGFLDVVKLLLDNGAKVDTQNKSGMNSSHGSVR